MPNKAPEWLNDDIKEFYDPNNVNIRAIQRAILEKRGVDIAYMTITDRMKRLGLERPGKKSKKTTAEATMTEETALTDEPSTTDDADTAPPVAEIHTEAVGEFDALPEGYAKTIQPMRVYTEAEEWALNKSMELYGFIGTIVYDQYGRILDGNQRQRVARLRGLAVPYTITQVRDDAHAIEIARALNSIRRHYTREQREELAPIMRDQGFSYRAIAEALGVGKSTVYRDVFGELRLRPESEVESEIVPNGTPDPVKSSEIVSNETPDSVKSDAPVPNGTISEMEPLTPAQPREPVERVKRKGGGTYPAQRPTKKGPKPFDVEAAERRIRDMFMEWLRHCEDQATWKRADDFIGKLAGLTFARADAIGVPITNTPVDEPSA